MFARGADLRQRKKRKVSVKNDPVSSKHIQSSLSRSYFWIVCGSILCWNIGQWTLFNIQKSTDIEHMYFGLTLVVQFTNYLIYGDRYAGYTIHRQLKVPESLRDKFNYEYDPQFLNYHLAQKLAPYIPTNRKTRVLDAGCGFGGTIFSLARQFTERDIEFLGLSINDQQISAARERAQVVCPDKCNFQTRSYMDMEGTFDVVIFIESFLHSPNKYKLLEILEGHISATGVLVMIDDMQVDNAPQICESNVRSFKQHWQGFSMTSAYDIESNSRFRVVYEEDLYDSFEVYKIQNPQKTRVMFAVYKFFQYIFWYGLCIPPLSNYIGVFCGCLAQQLAYYDDCLVYQFLILQ